MGSVRSTFKGILLIALLVGLGFLARSFWDKRDDIEVKTSDFDKIVVALRENSNRFEVQTLKGTVRTNRRVWGGPFNQLPGDITIKQPWSVAYFVDMKEISLEDYIYDENTKTLQVRVPLARPDPANIDESKQVVAYKGPFITRDMQRRLQREVAEGAKQQAATEASKPEHLAAANRAALQALKSDIEKPLKAAGVGNITVVIRTPEGLASNDSDRWDVSNSIAEVLARRPR